jgi:hypothetical protein
MVQQKGPIWESKFAVGKHRTCVANRTLLKGDAGGEISVRPPACSRFIIFPKRCRKLIRNGPAVGSDLGVEVGRRKNLNLPRQSNLAQWRRQGQDLGASFWMKRHH